MEKEIIIVFCICDEITQALKIVEDPQVKMTNSEIMTTALVSMLYFSGNFEKGQNFLAEHGYIKKMLSKSRFNRRIPQRIPTSSMESNFCLINSLPQIQIL
ncbi:hypothetical protein [Candidatus Uabimicrobium sp. HlEnr_7]|uniref:hypothetical protein n=1 Tax=Candidatus Uabimicrobium helgolandensis TaxID=3095367 RepID=UPI003558F4D1